MRELEGKVAIVTGSGRGIGKAIALAYGKAGAKVIVASLGKEESEITTREIESSGGTAIAVPTNVGLKEQVEAMVAKAASTYGRIDILVNTAQSFGTASKPAPYTRPQDVQSFDLDEIEWTMATGFYASLWAMQAVYPHFKKAGRGKVINFASIWGLTGNTGTLSYNVTKEAIRALTRTAAREWGNDHITVNNICPAAKTDAVASVEREHPEVFRASEKQIPIGYFGDPERDIAPVAIFLASEASDYMTGQTLNVDGGLYIAP